jgi:hypothetical protein
MIKDKKDRKKEIPREQLNIKPNGENSVRDLNVIFDLNVTKSTKDKIENINNNKNRIHVET